MNYVEFLRVMRTLRTVGYILGAILLLMLACRPFSHGGFNEPNTIGGIDPSTVAAHVNPDGSTTRSYTGRNGEHVLIRVGKDRIETITVDEPQTAGRRAHRNMHMQFGPVKITTSSTGHRRTRIITNDLNIPMYVLILIAGSAGAIVATIFGLALSRENDGHLELAWTKPTSRASYAFGSIATDVAGILATGVASFITIVIVLAVYGGAQYIRTGGHTLPALAFAIFFALSFYGIVLAATSSMRRGGLVLSLLWPVALILPGLVRVQWMSLGTVARTLNTINPVAYFYAFASSPDATRFFTLMPNGTTVQILALAALFAAGIVLSLAQWRRLEA